MTNKSAYTILYVWCNSKK